MSRCEEGTHERDQSISNRLLGYIQQQLSRYIHIQARQDATESQTQLDVIVNRIGEVLLHLHLFLVIALANE
jgi:hypothetical protein